MRPYQQHLQHLGRNRRCPGFVRDLHLTDALPLEHRFRHIVEQPNVGRFKGGRFGVGDTIQRHVRFELIDPDRLQAAIRTQGVDVGEGLFVLDPDARLQPLRNRAAHRLDAPFLRLLFGRRHDEFAE